MTAKKFRREGFVPEDYEFEIKRPDDQQYGAIDLEDMRMYMEAIKFDPELFGKVRYRPKGSTSNNYTQVDPKDNAEFIAAVCDACGCEVVHGVPETPEVLWENEPEPRCECEMGTILRFCCRDMMNGLLGGSGAITIKMSTGSIQVGGQDIKHCPYCGRPVSTSCPPLNTEA